MNNGRDSQWGELGTQTGTVCAAAASAPQEEPGWSRTRGEHECRHRAVPTHHNVPRAPVCVPEAHEDRHVAAPVARPLPQGVSAHPAHGLALVGAHDAADARDPRRDPAPEEEHVKAPRWAAGPQVVLRPRARQRRDRVATAAAREAWAHRRSFTRRQRAPRQHQGPRRDCARHAGTNSGAAGGDIFQTPWKLL